MQPRDDFEAFCREIGCEATDERFVFFLAGLQSTRTQQPVAFAPLVNGIPQGVLDAIQPGMRNIVPLYANPVAPVSKPALTREAIKAMWNIYYEGDPEGLARAVERYYRD